MKKIENIPVYDNDIMAIFADGNLYTIDNISAYLADDEDLPKKSIEKFAKVVEDFKSPYKLLLVYNEKFAYYNVAIEGFSENIFEWNDELNELFEIFKKYLKVNKITFE